MKRNAASGLFTMPSCLNGCGPDGKPGCKRRKKYQPAVSGETGLLNPMKGGTVMSVYKIVEIVGTSPKSWEDATQKALATAAKSLDELRVAEVVRQDVTVEKGKITAFRIRLNLSFKYHE
jgi:flavin-binding protein dodecin